MSKTHLKDTTGKIVLGGLALLLGETLLGYGLFWPFLLALMLKTRRTYLVGFMAGLMLSVMTATALGLASLVIVACLFIFERGVGWLLGNVWSMGLVAVVFGLGLDLVLGLPWSALEGLTVALVTMLLWKLGYFADEVHLSR